MEGTIYQMKKTHSELLEANQQIMLLEKAVARLVKALVPEDAAAPQSFLERLKMVPRQLKAFIKEVAETGLIHTLAVAKSRHPEVDISKFVEGAQPSCSKETFKDLKKEAEPVAKATSKSMRL